MKQKVFWQSKGFWGSFGGVLLVGGSIAKCYAGGNDTLVNCILSNLDGIKGLFLGTSALALYGRAVASGPLAIR